MKQPWFLRMRRPNHPQCPLAKVSVHIHGLVLIRTLEVFGSAISTHKHCRILDYLYEQWTLRSCSCWQHCVVFVTLTEIYSLVCIPYKWYLVTSCQHDISNGSEHEKPSQGDWTWSLYVYSFRWVFYDPWLISHWFTFSQTLPSYGPANAYSSCWISGRASHTGFWFFLPRKSFLYTSWIGQTMAVPTQYCSRSLSTTYLLNNAQYNGKRVSF
jgi:hypothetical protein